MDQYIWGLILTVIFGFVVMIILIIVFCSLKRYRSNPNPESKYDIFLHESLFNLKSLLLKLYQTPLSEIKSEIGDEAHHYLFLIKTLAVMTSILSPPTVMILIPVYQFGDFYTGDLLTVSLGNILNDQKLLAVPFVFFIIFIISCYYTLMIFMQETMKSSSISTINYSRLRIVGLPKKIPVEQLQKELASELKMETSNVYVVPDLSTAMMYEKFIDRADEMLLHYLDIEKIKGKRKRLSFMGLRNEKVDAIDYWKNQVLHYQEKLENEYKKSINRNSGVCIIKYKKKDALLKTLKGLHSSAHITRIVVPSDLNWENIQYDEFTTKVSHLGGTLLFFFMFLIIFTPTSFLNIIEGFLIDMGVGNIVIGLIEVYIPPILMIIYQLLLVPKSVEYLVKRERHYSKSGEVISSIRKFLLFFLFSMLFLPALGLSVVNIAYLAITSSFKEFSRNLTERIYHSIFWFLAAVFTQTFIVNFFDLTQLGNVIETKYKAARAVGEREEYNAYIPFPLIYPLEYSMLMTVFTMILLFSIAYPLILVFGCLYLWIKFYIHKYNIMFYFRKSYVKSHVSTIVAKSYLFIIVIFQWFTCFIFILSGFDSYIVLSSLIFFVAAISLPLIWMKYNHVRELLISEKTENLIDEVYIHPLQNACCEYIKSQSLVN